MKHSKLLQAILCAPVFLLASQHAKAETCQGKEVTIFAIADVKTVGTKGNDVILGTDSNDIIVAGKGDDTICAGLGDDKVFGGSGNDLINAGGGNDLVSGGSGDDDLFGGSGDDILKGENGNDRLFGEADSLVDANNDGVDDNASNTDDDRLVESANTGDDRLFGGDGIDSLDGGPGADQLFGGKNVDTLLGGLGDDKLNGGDGKDKILFDLDDTPQGQPSNKIDSCILKTQNNGETEIGCEHGLEHPMLPNESVTPLTTACDSTIKANGETDVQCEHAPELNTNSTLNSSIDDKGQNRRRK